MDYEIIKCVIRCVQYHIEVEFVQTLHKSRISTRVSPEMHYNHKTACVTIVLSHHTQNIQTVLF